MFQVDIFILKQVSVQKVKSIAISVELKKPTASWFLDDVEVYDPENSTVYKFSCKKYDT